MAAFAERTSPPDPAAALAGLLAERAQAGATASALRGIISAVRAVEDLQWLPPAVTTLHKRIAAGAAKLVYQPYLSSAGMVHLVERAKNSRYGAVFGALAILSWVCFLRVGEAACIRVFDLAMAGFVQFWYSKTGEEGYTTRPLCRYVDEVRAWLNRHMVSLGRSSDMLVWQSGEAALEAGMAESLAGTAYVHARWHALRRGRAAAAWARKPDLAYYKWWGRWQSTAVAMQYATKWSDPRVVACMVSWSRGLSCLHGLVTGGLCRFGSVWACLPCGDRLCSPVLRVLSAPRPSASQGGRGMRSRRPQRAKRWRAGTRKAEPQRSWRGSPGMILLRWARGLMLNLLPFPFGHPSLPLSAAPCLGKMRVSCARWRVLPLLGGGGGRAGTADGPINVDSDGDIDDDSGSSESEPDGAFAVGSTRDFPGRGQTGAAKFIGRERKTWFSKAAAGPVKGGAGALQKPRVVGRFHRTYAGPRRAQVVMGGTQALRPGAPARRQTGRPRLAQQGGWPVPKRTKLGTVGHVQAQAAESPVESTFVAAAVRLETKAKRRAVRVATASPSV